MEEWMEWLMALGSWFLEFGSWNLEFGSWYSAADGGMDG